MPISERSVSPSMRARAWLSAYLLSNLLGLAGWLAYVVPTPWWPLVDPDCITLGDALFGGMTMMLIGMPSICINVVAAIVVAWRRETDRTTRVIVAVVFGIWIAAVVVPMFFRRAWCG